MYKNLLKATFFLLLITGEAIAQFAGGSGTPGDPYQIATLAQFQEVQNYPSAHFIQTAHIDARETALWNDGAGFVPIGKITSKFTGTYDGGNFRIFRLTINRPEANYVGIFGYVDGGVIKNLTVSRAEITGGDNSGIIAGFSLNGWLKELRVRGTLKGGTHIGGVVGFNFGEVESVSANVEVAGRSYVGGLVGFNRGKITETSARGHVEGSGNGIGGLAGNNYDGEISRSQANVEVYGNNATSYGGLVGSNGGAINKSYAIGGVSGRSYVGGLAGFNRGEISETYAIGDIKSTHNGVGGLVGNNYDGVIKYSYAMGNVSGRTQVGGLIGVNRTNAVVEQTYAVSQVGGSNDVGGLIGLNNGTAKNSFWNIEESGQRAATGRGEAEGITGLFTDEMTGFGSEQHFRGFAFNRIWGSMPDDYPKLLWNIPYYIVEQIEAQNSIVSGDVLNLKIQVRNVGGVPDTNQVVLRDKRGRILHTSESLVLSASEYTNLEFGWQSTEQDKGEYEFVFQTHQDEKRIQFDVRLIPDQVEIEYPANLDDNMSLQPEFGWKPSSLAEKYELQIARDINFEQLVYNRDGITALNFKLPQKLDYLTDYMWRVRAKNADETGAWSPVFSFRTVIEKPETVKLTKPENETGILPTRPVLTWHSTSRAEIYKLQLAKDEDFESVVFDSTFSVSDTMYTFSRALEEDNVYHWRVQAMNDGGAGDWSEPQTFLAKRALTGNDDNLPIKFALEQNYPNPFNAGTVIRYGIPESAFVRLEVLNMLGQTVATLVSERQASGWHSVFFDASGLSSGFYIYRIKANDYESSRKLMVIK